ncbi:hypothetical protein DdX_08897 [Ditylenchus destructor]|uniref:Uncharacterized protein n=1 Tax=Ditylenchus destructor TaxID=166010 RepID=A0AAD4R758_9BILA|nr:hypothetical protein DdX_08897 [Ditylenchus destructor]
MGANLGKSQSYHHTSARPNCYGLPPRRKTVPNENGNHFMKEYWERNPGGPMNARPGGTEFWMIESEKQYRQEVFQRNSENVYRQSPSSYQRSPRSFEVVSPFSSSTQCSGRSTASPSTGTPNSYRSTNNNNSPSSCAGAYGHSLYGGGRNANTGNNNNNVNKYIPQLGMGV